MRKRQNRYSHYIAFLFLFIGFAQSGWAQQKITGAVTDNTGNPAIGVSVTVLNSQDGTLTDAMGQYSITLYEGQSKLVFSSFGFQTQTVDVSGKSILNVSLNASEIQLEEVVITALGVSREERALGYAVQGLKSKDIASVPAPNAVDNLSGKLAGVYVTSGSAGPTASANVTIRGQTSLNGNSQALFIVNGVPITNGLFSPGDGLNGSSTIDFGNGAQIINSFDIENISVLKGPAAAALYGSRAANGVIYVTTKTGKNSKGWGVSVNSNTVIETPLKLPNFQDQFGNGGYGKYSYSNGATYTGDYYDAFGENWGPRTNGQLIKQWNSNGEAVPFEAAPNNMRNFFQTGVSTNNNVSISHADENGDFRFSATQLNRRGIVPNTDLNRSTLQTSVGKKLFNNRLEFRANAMYVGSGSNNVPNAGYDESSSVMYSFLWLPRNTAIDDLREYWKPGQENVQQAYVEELWGNNPWMIVNENTNSFNARRLLGDINATYHINDRTNLRVRTGQDMKNDIRQYRRATSTKKVLFGSFREDRLSFMENNTEALLSWANAAPLEQKDLRIDAKLGGNLMLQQSSSLIANNPQLLQPGVFTLTNNRSNVQTEGRYASKAIRSVFGMASFAYKSMYYLDLSARNDWSSTLPVENNSYFYPAASASVVVSEMADLGKISFLKLRGALAQVGSDTDPYLLNNTYSPSAMFGGYPAFGINSFATNPGLRPERTTSSEFGIDARFAKGRFGMDLAVYDMTTKDQIIYLPVASSTGRSSRLANGGAIRNTGIELQLYGDLVKTNNFKWNSRINLGGNRAVVVSLPEGVSGGYPIVANMFPNDGGTAGLEYVAVEGELLGQLKGLTFERDTVGNIIHQDGYPVVSEEKRTIGSYQPKARIGWMNSFSVGNWQANILFDGQIGGLIYSRSHTLHNTAGNLVNDDDPHLDMNAIDGRAISGVSYDSNGQPVYTEESAGGVVGAGVMYDSNGNLVENTVSVPLRDYYYKYYGNVWRRDNIEPSTFDASYLKLRQLSVAYTVPKEKLANTGLEGLTISFIGRNLLLFSKVPTIDPETYSIRNGLFVNGYESTSMPSLRSFGFSINANL
ncbi:SusC/RagA family TonB-linked outer membrane protein [Schleiferiaceae bacterium]|nr:SusC/RagA family TonB-linked outer membrane protein [Schleiferiaceae bacterium]